MCQTEQVSRNHEPAIDADMDAAIEAGKEEEGYEYGIEDHEDDTNVYVGLASVGCQVFWSHLVKIDGCHGDFLVFVTIAACSF